MTTKLDKMMAYGVGPPYTKSHDSLIMWLYVALWQKKRCISNSTSLIDTKLDKVVAHDIGTKLKKSHQEFQFRNFFPPQIYTDSLK